ncbi:MAG: YciI family protein [Alphaproteobacteria bacterium]|nr:YciI family protein [Alphaproteobacteria bacterium]MBV9154203.1 YciI family protein [Alphaproteobacteria bacterium]
MRFMVMVRADECSEAGGMPSSEMLAAMGKFNEEMVKAGVMLAGEGLHPSKRATRLKFSGAAPTVIDGPFPAKELVCGFWILQVTSKEEAIEWMKRAPFGGGAQIEIRQVFEAEDFGPDFTCEMREKEEHMRAEIAKRQ